MFVPRKILEENLKNLLAEDIGMGDVTSAAVIPLGLQTQAEVIAKGCGIAAGIEEATILAESLGLEVKTKVADGEETKPGQRIMEIFGDGRTLLSSERTMLNLLSRMSGIATQTRRLTEMLKKANSTAKIAATRKTAPGLLYFDKKAVIVGGGDPHRLHLDDMLLLKDNHIAIVGDVGTAVKIAKQQASFCKKIEAEVSRVADVLQAAEAGADAIMFDNFSPKMIKEAVRLLKKAGFFGKILLEASGGITAENLVEYASTNVDIISIGELTHSVQALDMSLEITQGKQKGKTQESKPF